jgi:hypothetical protein
MIDVKNFVAVAGMSGVQKLIAVRSNGLIIENFDTKERKFTPMRSHEFSPFETISVYIDGGDTVTLAQVITNMKAQLADNPIPSEKDASPVLRNYLIKILPEHDRDRVHISDIKKMIKWFNFLNSRDLLQEALVVEATQTEAATETATEEKIEA